MNAIVHCIFLLTKFSDTMFNLVSIIPVPESPFFQITENNFLNNLKQDVRLLLRSG